MNQDRQPKLAELAKEVPAREAWRVFGIMAELLGAALVGERLHRAARRLAAEGMIDANDPLSPAEREVLLNL